MVSKEAYTDAGAVAAYLGRQIPPAAGSSLADYLDAATDLIDRFTGGGGWNTPPVVAERYDLTNSAYELYLRSAPVASITQILVRSVAVGDPGTLLVVGQDYELLTPARGLVLLSPQYVTRGGSGDGAPLSTGGAYTQAGFLRGAPSRGIFALVDYTPDNPAPPAIALAACQIVAHWLEFAIFPGRLGVSEIRTRDQTVKSEGGVTTRLLPAEVTEILSAKKTILF